MRFIMETPRSTMLRTALQLKLAHSVLFTKWCDQVEK